MSPKIGEEKTSLDQKKNNTKMMMMMALVRKRGGDLAREMNEK